MKRLTGVLVIGAVVAFAASSWGAAWYQNFMPRSQSRTPAASSSEPASTPAAPISKVRNFESVGSYINLQHNGVLAVLQEENGGTLLVGRSADDGRVETSAVICIQKTGSPVSCSRNAFTDSTGLSIPATRNAYLFVDSRNRVVGGAGLTDDQARIISEKVYGGAPLARALTSNDVQRDLLDSIRNTMDRGGAAADIPARVADTASRVTGRAMDPKLIKGVIEDDIRTTAGGNDKGKGAAGPDKDIPCETLDATKSAKNPDAGKGPVAGTKEASGRSDGDSNVKTGFSKGSQEFAQGQWKAVCDRGESLMKGLELAAGSKDTSPMNMTGKNPCDPKKLGSTKSGRNITTCGGTGTGGAGGMKGDGGGNVLQTGDACGGKALSMKEVAGASGKSKYLGSYSLRGEDESYGATTEVYAKVYADPSDMFRVVQYITVTFYGPDGKEVGSYEATKTSFALTPGEVPKLLVTSVPLPGGKETILVEAWGKPGKELKEKMNEVQGEKKPPESKGPPPKDDKAKTSNCGPTDADCGQDNMNAEGQVALEKKQKEDSAEKAKGGGVTDPSPIEGSETVYYTDECGNFLAQVAPCSALDAAMWGKGWDYSGGGGNMPGESGGLKVMPGGFGCAGGKLIKGTNPVADGSPIMFKGSMIIPLSSQPSPNDGGAGSH